MTYSDAANLAVSTAMKIAVNVQKVLPRINPSCTIKEYSESSGHLNLYLFTDHSDWAFAILEIEFSQYSENEMAVNVYAELTSIDFRDDFPDDYSSDAIMDKYTHLKPIVKEGIIHRVADSRVDKPGVKRVANCTFSVRYSVFCEQYKRGQEPEPPDFDIDEDEIAEKTVPYVQSLYEIHNDIMAKSTERTAKK